MPAAATMTTPLLRALVMASLKPVEICEPPKLKLIISARLTGTVFESLVKPAAKRTACSASYSLPAPPRPNTRKGMICVNQPTPATPTPLLVAAPIVPATCVPWNVLLLSRPSLLPGSLGLLSMPSPSLEVLMLLTKS